MAKKTPQKRDGVYQRKDRPGWWISWKDAQDAMDEPRAKPLCLGVSDIFLDLCLILAEVGKSTKKTTKK